MATERSILGSDKLDKANKRIKTLFGAENWALLASPIANCKMCNVDPVSYPQRDES